MALTKEDGTGVNGANTYVLVTDARTYAQARGVLLPADDLLVESLIVKGMDYIESLRAQYQATKTYTGVVGFHANDDFSVPPPDDVDTHPAQALQWPRYGVSVDDVAMNGNTIPNELIAALCQCVIEINDGSDLQANGGGQVVKSEKVDVLQTTYMTSDEMGATGLALSFPKVDALLAPLLSDSSAFLRSARV